MLIFGGVLALGSASASCRPGATGSCCWAAAGAPVLFGLLTGSLAGVVGMAKAMNLRDTFLLMVVPLLANGLVGPAAPTNSPPSAA
nr:hypothetical protein GCM10020063_038670 [Dactylosporangium thailandense]